MSLLKKNLSRIFLIILILTPLFFSMLPPIIQYQKTPPDRAFLGLHRWSEDYFGYLHTINQGTNGHLAVLSRLSNEKHNPAFIHSEYAFLGLIGGLFNLNSVAIYNVSRFILGGIFLSAAYYFFLRLFSKIAKNNTSFLAKTSFFLSFFVGGFYIVKNWQPLAVEPYLFWWVELDATRRSTILPHYLMGSIFMLTSFLLLEKILQNNTRSMKQFLLQNKINFLLLFSSTFLLSFVHPVNFALTLFILLIYFSLSLLIQFLMEKNIINLLSNIKRYFLIFLSSLLGGIIPVIYYKYLFTQPLYRFVQEHGTTTHYNIPLLEFFLALGPVFFIAVIGLIFTFFTIFIKVKSKSNTNNLFSLILPLSWIIGQFFFFFIGYQILNFDRLRTIHAPLFLPLSFFATLAIFNLNKILKNSLRTIIFIFLCGLLFFVTLPLSYHLIKSQIYEISDFKSFPSFPYPSKATYESYLFLKQNTKEKSVITTGYEARFQLPAIANNTIAFGANFENDPLYARNAQRVTEMYQGILKGDELKKFLINNDISYVYWGYQEKSYGGNLAAEKFLRKIFENSEVTIFELQ